MAGKSENLRQVRTVMAYLLGALTVILAIGFILYVEGCAKAHADGYSAQVFTGPENSTCFVILNGTTPVGGNCQK